MELEFGGEEHTQVIGAKAEDMLDKLIMLAEAFETREERRLFFANIALAIRADVEDAGDVPTEIFREYLQDEANEWL